MGSFKDNVISTAKGCALTVGCATVAAVAITAGLELLSEERRNMAQEERHKDFVERLNLYNKIGLGAFAVKEIVRG